MRKAMRWTMRNDDWQTDRLPISEYKTFTSLYAVYASMICHISLAAAPSQFIAILEMRMLGMGALSMRSEIDLFAGFYLIIPACNTRKILSKIVFHAGAEPEGILAPMQ